MAESRCPLCQQPLPSSVTPSQLKSRIDQLAEPKLAAEKRRLEKELHEEIHSARAEERNKLTAEFAKKMEAERAKAQRAAETRSAAEIKALRKQVSEADARARKEAQEQFAKKLADADDKRELAIERERNEREKERLRHAAETVQLKSQLETLSRKLERQSGERLGEEAELDLFSELSRAFPHDKIQRVGRGTKGADIVQYVMDGSNEVGKVVYESKNVTTWSNAFIAQASKYAAQYETPYVMIVTRAFPKKERDFCTVQKMPVVRPRMAVSLARVMRESIVAIGRLRLSGAGRDQKAHELMQYLVSDRFATRFKGIGDGVDSLRDQQLKERTWHENAWESRSALHEKIDKNRREIDAQLQTILTTRKTIAMAARA